MNQIFARVSIRKYQDRPVETEKTMAILRAAMQAPSAANQQPWEFYVVTNPEMIAALSRCSPYATPCAGAPVVFVPCWRKGTPVPAYAQIDMSASVENLLLQADEEGLGAVWMGIAPQDARMADVAQAMNLPDTLLPFALVSCGYPAQQRQQEDRYDPARVHWIE